jgi:MFS family permease
MNHASRTLRRSATCATLAAATGLGIGWLDLHTTEVIVTILALLLAGLLLGLLQPTAAWRWAVLLALGLPVMAAGGQLLRVRTPEPIRLDPRIVLVAMAFALLGCYSGAAVRRSGMRARRLRRLSLLDGQRAGGQTTGRDEDDGRHSR